MKESIVATFSIPLALALRELMEWHGSRKSDITWLMLFCCSILTCVLFFTQKLQSEQTFKMDTFYLSLLAGFFYASQAVVNERIFKIDERVYPL